MRVPVRVQWVQRDRTLERCCIHKTRTLEISQQLAVDATLTKQSLKIQKSIWCSYFQVTQQWVWVQWVQVRVQVMWAGVRVPGNKDSSPLPDSNTTLLLAGKNRPWSDMQNSQLLVRLRCNPSQTSTKLSQRCASAAVESRTSADDCTQPCAPVLDASADDSFLRKKHENISGITKL